MDNTSALAAFEALSQETRLAVLRLLVPAGPAGLPAGAVAERLDARQNTMSSHLKVLHDAGLIDSRREGRSIIYTANYGTVRRLILFLMEDCCAGNAEVCGPLCDSERSVSDRPGEQQ
jgi:DNA-binding transcriptional ArsR family regulator